MKTFFKIASIFLLFTQFSIAQKTNSIPPNFSKLDGMEYVENITFYYNSKTQSFLALQNDTVKWQANINSVCKHKKKKIKIALIQIDNEYLKIEYNKNNIAKIEIKTGNVICVK